MIRQLNQDTVRVAYRKIRHFFAPSAAQPDWTARVMPSFIIVGAQRAGTSSLYAYLQQHPQVMGAIRKEVHFFDDRFHAGMPWYAGHFPSRHDVGLQEGRLQKRVITGEATPYYMFHPHAVKRIASLLPDVKLIVLLRDPTARAYSHYNLIVKLGKERLTFSEALACEDSRLAGEIEKMTEDESYYSQAHKYYSYKARGVYVTQLERLAGHFNRDQIMVLSSEALFSDTQKTYDEVLHFLKLDPYVLENPVVHNAIAPSTKAIPMEAQLRSFFQPYNASLYRFLGRDLGW